MTKSKKDTLAQVCQDVINATAAYETALADYKWAESLAERATISLKDARARLDMANDAVTDARIRVLKAA